MWLDKWIPVYLLILNKSDVYVIQGYSEWNLVFNKVPVGIMELAFKGQALLKLSHILVTEEMSFFLSLILSLSLSFFRGWN